MDRKNELLVSLLLVEKYSLPKEEEVVVVVEERKQRWRERRGRMVVRWMEEVG